MRTLFKRAGIEEAQPSLRGLIVPNADTGGLLPKPRLYPWARVEGKDELWFLYDDECGVPSKKRTRCRISSPHVQRVAVRAQVRYLKHALDRNELALSETMESPVLPGWILIVSGIILAGFMVPTLLRIPRAIMKMFEMDPKVGVCSALISIVLVGMAMLMCGGAVFSGWVCVRWMNVRQAKLDAGGILATLRNGTELYRPWAELVFASVRINRLRFADGAALGLFGTRWRLKRLLIIVKERYLPALSVSSRDKYRRAGQRLIIWSVVLAIVGGLMASCLPPTADVKYWAWKVAGGTLGMGVLFAVFVTYMEPVGVWYQEFEARHWRTQRARQRAAQVG